jgi:2'-5' RNA ligase
MSNSDPTPWRSDVCMASRRLFIGLMANAAAQAAISQYQLRCDWPSTARLTDPGRLHITLAFLGNVEDTDEARD